MSHGEMMIKIVCAILVLLISGCHDDMVVSQGYVENFNGVDITFSPPYRQEQRSFQLRGVINKQETEILVEAIPVIAKFLNYIRRNDIGFPDGLSLYRTPYEFIDGKDVSVGVVRTHRWRITNDSIQFVADYIVSYGKIGDSVMDEHYFRDAYLFKKMDGKWLFVETIGSKPYGFLKCKRVDKKCTADVDLW